MYVHADDTTQAQQCVKYQLLLMLVKTLEPIFDYLQTWTRIFRRVKNAIKSPTRLMMRPRTPKAIVIEVSEGLPDICQQG